MKPFVFQKFSISQSKEVFRVGTDGVLLGALASAENTNEILEIGTGTGLISLMLAQRYPDAKVQAIDINEHAVNLARQNFKNSPFSERLEIDLQDFKKFKKEKKYNLVVCNPPFFEENQSEKDVLARQQVELTFEHLITKSSECLSHDGVFSVIIPSVSSEDFVRKALDNQLNLVKRIDVYGIEGGLVKRNILEFSFAKKTLDVVSFTIEKYPRVYSDEYLELTKSFHVFGK